MSPYDLSSTVNDAFRNTFSSHWNSFLMLFTEEGQEYLDMAHKSLMNDKKNLKPTIRPSHSEEYARSFIILYIDDNSDKKKRITIRTQGKK